MRACPRGEPSLAGRVMTSEEFSGPSSDLTITEHELEECKRANETGRPPVVFVHGLWLLPSRWDSGSRCLRKMDMPR
jgi:hypothetical protein